MLREARFASKIAGSSSPERVQYASDAKSLARRIIRKSPDGPEAVEARSILLKLEDHGLAANAHVDQSPVITVISRVAIILGAIYAVLGLAACLMVGFFLVPELYQANSFIGLLVLSIIAGTGLAIVLSLVNDWRGLIGTSHSGSTTKTERQDDGISQDTQDHSPQGSIDAEKQEGHKLQTRFGRLAIALIIVPIVLAIGLGAMMITIMSGEGFGIFLVLFLFAGGWLFFKYFFR